MKEIGIAIRRTARGRLARLESRDHALPVGIGRQT